MYKIFAKPLFLGKKVVFLPECHSTNSELIEQIRNASIPEGAIVYTAHQLSGRGQRGNAWVSEPGKNILMSVLLRPTYLLPTDLFLLNCITGLALIDFIKEANAAIQPKLKWPNDVYVNDRKLSGILIETNFRGQIIEYAVVGIGLNLNQSHMPLPNATSLLLESGTTFNVEDSIESILLFMEKWLIKLKTGNKQSIIDAYHTVMFGKGEQRGFRSGSEVFSGEIMGVDSVGNLLVDVSGKIMTFGIKEIEFLF